MADEPLTADRVGRYFFEILAFGSGCEAVTSLKNREYLTALLGAGITLVLLLVGFHWSSLRRIVGKGWSVLIIVLLGSFTATLPFIYYWHEPFSQLVYDPHWRIAMLAVTALYAVVYSVVYVRSLRRDFDAYIKPRVVTRDQADQIKTILLTGKPHKITVKVNPHDQEALEYGAQLRNAIRAGGWDVEFSTSNGPPNPDTGLAIHEDGFQKRTKEHDERTYFLRKAMEKARVEIPGMSASNGDEEYKLYIVVGKRPFNNRRKAPLTFRFGLWQIRRF